MYFFYNSLDYILKRIYTCKIATGPENLIVNGGGKDFRRRIARNFKNR